MKKIMMLFLLAPLWGYAQEREVPTFSHGWQEDDQYLYYRVLTFSDSDDKKWTASREVVYTWKETETVDGKSYFIVYNALRKDGREQVFPILMRRDGKRLLVRYEEYKRFMQESRGRDMSDFDRLCQYEVTPDGEMVLYDFGMQVGDRFRGAEGGDEVYVVDRRPAEGSDGGYRSDVGTLECLVLSNGAWVMDDIGLAYFRPDGRNCRADFFDYLNPQNGNLQQELIHVQLGGIRVYDSHSESGDIPSGILRHPELSSKAEDDANVYSLSGGKQPASTHSGAYIRNGRKIVAK